MQRALKASIAFVDQYRLVEATAAYLEFLKLGGCIRMRPLNETLVMETLEAGRPILCGVSATYLYSESRERPRLAEERDPARPLERAIYDDVGGHPAGHFVIVHGYDRSTGTVVIADPLHPNPLSQRQTYTAPFSQLAASILLGILTYDANLLVIEPKGSLR